MAMNNPETFKNPCAICHRRPATRYCDYIIGYSHLQLFMRSYKQAVEESGPDYETCDLPMCDECAKKISREIDFCPYHYDLFKQAKELPENLRKAQSKAKMKIRHELMKGE